MATSEAMRFFVLRQPWPSSGNSTYSTGTPRCSRLCTTCSASTTGPFVSDGDRETGFYDFTSRQDFDFTSVTARYVDMIVIDNFFTIDKALRIHAGYYGVNDDRAWR